MLIREQDRVMNIVSTVVSEAEGAAVKEWSDANTKAMETVLAQPDYVEFAKQVSDLFGYNGESIAKRLNDGVGFYVSRHSPGRFTTDLVAAGFKKEKPAVYISRSLLELRTALAMTKAKWKDVEMHVYALSADLANARSEDDIAKAIRTFTAVLP